MKKKRTKEKKEKSLTPLSLPRPQQKASGGAQYAPWVKYKKKEKEKKKEKRKKEKN